MVTKAVHQVHQSILPMYFWPFLRIKERGGGFFSPYLKEKEFTLARVKDKKVFPWVSGANHAPRVDGYFWNYTILPRKYTDCTSLKESNSWSSKLWGLDELTTVRTALVICLIYSSRHPPNAGITVIRLLFFLKFWSDSCTCQLFWSAITIKYRRTCTQKCDRNDILQQLYSYQERL